MRYGKRALHVLNVLLILSIALMFPISGFAQAPQPDRFTATPLTPESTISVPKAVSAGQKLVPVIVELSDQPLATYSGGLPGLAATSPRATGAKKLNPHSAASQAYLKHLEQKQNDFKARAQAAVPQGKVTQQLSVALNAVAMTVPADQVAALSQLPDVAAVYPDELTHPDTDNSPQFIGAPAVWSKLGGQESSGEGVIVGVIDTGIWPEHPSFADPDPSGKAYALPPAAPSGQPRACQFSGGANPGPAFTCNNKLIAAYVKMATYNSAVGADPGGYTSARDADGHGTHTSSTAAGNAGVQASIFGIPRGTVSGIAPRAYVIMFKVCGAQGCFSSDSAAAVQQAILDGVDVINFSISGGANPYSDAVEQAFLNAYAAGVFVAASAGNSGPAADTTDHRGPWVTTVAASTQNRAFENTATLTDGGASLTVHGASLTQGVGPAPVFVPTADPLCIGPFAPGSLAGQIVVCKRGTNGRAEKGYRVLQGGAVGMILYNNAANVTDLETDNHYLPATHIQFADGTAVLNFLAAHPNARATLTQGAKVAAQGDVMASFSSRGGPGQTLGVSKPDITAPGVQILAGASPQHFPPDQGGVALGPQGEQFQAIAGTSMSSPHIAGSGALLAALHPDWTPGQIKSALMTTARTQVVKEDGVTPANAFDFGSGRVNLNVAGDPGVTFDATAQDYAAHAADLWNANYPSVFVPIMPGQITVQRTMHSVVSGYAIHWVTSVSGASDFSVNVTKNLTVPAGQDLTFAITIDARNVPVGQVRMATLNLTEVDDNGARQLHLPITFIRKQPVVTLSKTCAPATFPVKATTDCAVSATNLSFSPATVSISDQLPGPLKLVSGSVTGGVQLAPNKVGFQGTLAGAQPPDVSIAAGASPGGGYLPLSLFGIAPISGVTDDSVTNFNVPAFNYGSVAYTRLGVGSNGYLVVGGSSGSADVQFLNQHFPDPTRPNNVLSPFWTDFNPPAGGAIRIATLTNGADTWIVVDWAGVKEFSTARFDSFEVWIGVNNDTHPGEDISFAYGPIGGTGDNNLMTAGAENLFGNRGANYYYNGTGTLPANGTQLVVTTTPPVPGETHVLSFKAAGAQVGKWTNYAEMTGDLFQGINVAGFSGEVTK